MHFIVIEHHIESDDATIKTDVAHKYGQVHQLVAVAVVLQWQQNLFVVALLVVIADEIVLQDNALRGIFGDKRRDDTSKENHHHHTVEHVFVYQILAIANRQLDSHHDNSNRTGSVGRGKTEHHVPVSKRKTKAEAAKIARNHLSHGTDNDDDGHHVGGVPAFEKSTNVDQHSYANQEIGNEQRVSDEFQPVHQRGNTRDIAVQRQSGKEGSQDAFESDERCDGRTEKHHGHHKDKLCDGIAVSLQKPSCHPGQDVNRTRYVKTQFQQRKEE